jgi:hypothetical protein
MVLFTWKIRSKLCIIRVLMRMKNRSSTWLCSLCGSCTSSKFVHHNLKMALCLFIRLKGSNEINWFFLFLFGCINFNLNALVIFLLLTAIFLLLSRLIFLWFSFFHRLLLFFSSLSFCLYLCHFCCFGFFLLSFSLSLF